MIKKRCLTISVYGGRDSKPIFQRKKFFTDSELDMVHFDVITQVLDFLYDGVSTRITFDFDTKTDVSILDKV